VAGENALAMEQRLAELADIVVLVVESPGTFAELGAFSIHTALRSKLLPILDAQFRSDPSFINSGPVRWIDSDSTFAPCIWVSMQSVLSCAAELDDRLNRLPSQHDRRARDLHSSLKHLLLLVTDIVSVFAPCRLEHVHFYLNSILNRDACVNAATLLALACSVGLISTAAGGDNIPIYWCRTEHQSLRAADHKISLPFSTLRARLVSAMQSIPTAVQDLHRIIEVERVRR
jgi:hypothetical protein